MMQIIQFITVIFVSTSVIATPTPGWQAHASDVDARPKAAYLITNEANNAVVALPIGADGKLVSGNIKETGGMGANSIDSTTNEEIAPDALLSQSSITLAGNVSNTVARKLDTPRPCSFSAGYID